MRAENHKTYSVTLTLTAAEAGMLCDYFDEVSERDNFGIYSGWEQFQDGGPDDPFLTGPRFPKFLPLLKKVSGQLHEVIPDEARNAATCDFDPLLTAATEDEAASAADSPLLPIEPPEPGETPEQYARYKEHVRNIAAACENSADWTEEARRSAFLMFEELGVASRALQRYFDEGGAHGPAENARVMNAARAGFQKRVRRFWPSYKGIQDGTPIGPEEDK